MGLCIATEAIDDIVNHALLEVHAGADSGEATVMFSTAQHRDLFLIRALDFVSESGSPLLSGIEGSCLAILAQATQRCTLGTSEDAARLNAAVEGLKAWIGESVPLPLWLPTLQREVTLTVPRRELVRLCGNQAKHNLSRLTRVAGALRSALNEVGASVTVEEVLLALNDFKEPLGEGYFLYHATRLVELLNEVRWGIQVYLRPVFEEAYTPDEGAELRRWTYRMPLDVRQDIPQSWFWRLMNLISRDPVVRSFRTPDCLRKRP